MSDSMRRIRRRPGLFIGRYFKIEFYLDYSWFLIAAILTYTLATDHFPHALRGQTQAVYAVMGTVAAALFFLSILLHELGHSLVSQRCGIPVPRITLLFIGGLAEIAREPDDAKSELKIALGGPAVSVLLAGFFWMVAQLADSRGWRGAELVSGWLALTNIALVIFNMIPGYPLDGGRVLRALLWRHSGRLRKATYITSRIGIGFSWLLIGLGVFVLVHWQDWHGFVHLLIGFFLKSAAESGYANALQREVLAGVTVRDIMTANPVWIADTLPLSLAADQFFLAGHHVAYPVCTDELTFRGLLRLEMLKKIPREKWPYLSAGDAVAEASADELRIGLHESAGRAMRRLLGADQGRLAVVDRDKLVGVVTRHDVLHFIEIHTELEE